MRRATLSILAILLLAGSPAGAAGQAGGGARITDLLMLMDAADPQAAQDAAATLVTMGPSIGPALVDALRDRKSCQGRWLISGVLHTLGVEPAAVETTRIAVAQGDCFGLGPRDVQVQQEAALAIVDRPAGVRALAAMLRGKDAAQRLKAATALDRLTARLDAGASEPIAATPALLDAAAAALPALQKAALDDKDASTRCAAHAALDRAGRSPHDALRLPAAKLLAGRTFPCAPAPAAAPAGATTAAPNHRDAIERAVRRLDQEKPETAQATVSTLIGYGAEAVPVVVARMGQTQRCRALALGANVLSRQEAAPDAAEAALRRVLRGACEGRDDFDRELAQGAANALVVRAGGIAMLTPLLAEADPVVRGRAARALVGLYERLGAGNAGVPVDDPAILGAAVKAIAPLVPVATADPDDDARCQAVRALRAAQTSVHEPVRAEAEAQTAGRSLRCAPR